MMKKCRTKIDEIRLLCTYCMCTKNVTLSSSARLSWVDPINFKTNMAATVKKLHDTMISVEPPLKFVDYETEYITSKFLPKLEVEVPELVKKGDFMAQINFSLDYIVVWLSYLVIFLKSKY